MLKSSYIFGEKFPKCSFLIHILHDFGNIFINFNKKLISVNQTDNKNKKTKIKCYFLSF